MNRVYRFDEFQYDVIRIAKDYGFKIGYLRGTDILQVDFGHKKLHGNHLRALFPNVLSENADINKLIEKVAPGRPCTHLPFRKIVMQIKNEHPETVRATTAGKGVQGRVVTPFPSFPQVGEGELRVFMKRKTIHSEMPDLVEAIVNIKEHREELVHVL